MRTSAALPTSTRSSCNIIPDNSVRAVGLESGDLDLIQSPMAGQDVKRLKTNPKLKLTQTTGLGITYININTTDPLFSDVKVRQALAYLVDRKTIVDTIYEGMDVAGISSAIPGTWWAAPNVKGYTYDPAKATALLTEAGWKDKGADGILAKDGKQFKFKLTTYNDPNRMQVDPVPGQRVEEGRHPGGDRRRGVGALHRRGPGQQASGLGHRLADAGGP